MFQTKISDHSVKLILVIGAVVTALITLSYLGWWWNHFLGLRSAHGGYLAAMWFREGCLPYRDYFVPHSPLLILRSVIVQALFGNDYIVLRTFAVCERTILAVVIYLWLARLFPPGDAAWVAAVTVILGSGDVADPLDQYTNECILFAITSGLCASLVLDKVQSVRKLIIWAALSGISAGVACFAKQSIGPVATILIFLVTGASLLRFDGKRKAITFALAFTLGWILPILTLVFWLMHVGVFNSFVEQVFITAPRAKSIDSIFARLAYMCIAQWIVSVPSFALALIAWPVFIRAQREKTPQSTSHLLMLLLLGLVSTTIGAVASYQGLYNLTTSSPLILSFWLALKTTIWIVYFVSITHFLLYTFLWFSKNVSKAQAQIWLYLSTTFAIVCTASMSYPLYEAMLIPGLAIFLALALNACRHYRLKRVWLFAIYVVSAGLVAIETILKVNLPHNFQGFSEPPVPTANTISTLPLLKGFVLPPSTVHFVDDTVHIIKANSAPSDPIFTYPELGLIYALSERRTATFSGTHNLDVVNDQFAEEEAKRLLQNKPKVLIYYRENEGLLKSLEETWRQGKPSGHRALIAACETLAKEYRLFETFTFPSNEFKVMVLVRPDATKPAAF